MSTVIEIPDDGRPVFTLRLRVRFYEMDSFGHVNNAVYLNYLEQAATEHAEFLGFGQSRLAELGGFFVVRRHEVEYFSSAAYGDELEVTTWPETLHGPRAIRCYLITNAETGRKVVAARTHWIWINAASGRPSPMPRELMSVFLASTGADPDAVDY